MVRCIFKSCKNELSGTGRLILIWRVVWLQDLVQGFDQEAAAVVMARLASYKMEMEVLITFHRTVVSIPYANLLSFGRTLHFCSVHHHRHARMLILFLALAASLCVVDSLYCLLNFTFGNEVLTMKNWLAYILIYKRGQLIKCWLHGWNDYLHEVNMLVIFPA